MGKGFRLGSILGFEIRIDYSWFVIFFLVLWSLTAGFFPQTLPERSTGVYLVMGTAGTLLFFASLLAHELSHSVVARTKGIPVEGITLFIFGGMARTRLESEDPMDEILIAGIGPVASVVIGGLFLGLAQLGGALGWPASVNEVSRYLGFINFLLAAFNLLPGFPLDGGRLFRGLLWKVTGNPEKATRWATNGGIWLGYGLMALGFLQAFAGAALGGLWMVFIGWFLRGAAEASYGQHVLRRILEGVLAEVPDGFEMLQNDVGTAVGLWYADETPGRSPRLIAVLPGVPEEMKSIFDTAVAPRLTDRTDVQDLAHRTLLTTGVPESSLQQKIGDLSDWLSESLKLAYLPSTSGVRLRLTAFGEDKEEAEARIDDLEAELRRRIGKYVFGMGKDTLEGVIGELLKDEGLTVATAESATGGLIGHRLTKIPGSSAYFWGGVIAYANEVKTRLLEVDEATLAGNGAVSEPVAGQMARGVRQRLGTHIGISTTGIAGPGGGSEEKPVGTVCIGFAMGEPNQAPNHVKTVRLQLTNDRKLNKELFATSALEMIRRQLVW